MRTRGGRTQAVKDMLRQEIPMLTTGTDAIPFENNVFKAVFPDGTTLKSSSSNEANGFPLHFHWETVIATDGTSTSTDIVVE